MRWFTQLFVGHGLAQSLVALGLTAALGLRIGLIRFGGVLFGAGGVLFSGAVRNTPSLSAATQMFKEALAGSPEGQRPFGRRRQSQIKCSR